jgi:hypothetical protein
MIDVANCGGGQSSLRCIERDPPQRMCWEICMEQVIRNISCNRYS